MQKTPDRRAVVVCDACVLINFLIVGRVDLLLQSPEHRFVVTEHVIAEVTEPDQRKILKVALEQGEIEQVDLTGSQGLSIFAELTAVLGSGEAAAIALAVERNWAIATDEKGRTLREIESRLGGGRLLTTPGILLQAIRKGVLTAEQADDIKRKLEERRFKMSFSSFADLL